MTPGELAITENSPMSTAKIPRIEITLAKNPGRKYLGFGGPISFASKSLKVVALSSYSLRNSAMGELPQFAHACGRVS